MALGALTGLSINPSAAASFTGLEQTPLPPAQEGVSTAVDALGAAAVPQHLIPGHPPGSATYGQMLALSPNHPERFSGATARELRALVDSRRSFRPDSRPLALLVYPTADDNGAFDHCAALDLMRQGYQVVYVEARTPADLTSAITTYGQQQRISLLVVAGHGNPTSLNMGAHRTVELDNNPEPGGRMAYKLDTLDLPAMRRMSLDRYMAADSVVLLQSCSNGRGGRTGGNLVSGVGQVFRSSTVIGADQDFDDFTLEYDDEDRVISARFSHDGRPVSTIHHRPTSR